MKLFYIAAAALPLALSGCIVTSSKPTGKYAQIANSSFEMSADPTKVLTRGQVTCEPGLICPELSVDWKQTADQLYKINIDIYDKEKYDIQKFLFIIDGQNYPYIPEFSTKYRTVPESTVIDSSNYVSVPFSFLKRLKDAENVQLKLSTNKGEITNYLLNNGKQSNAYKLFIRRMNKT
ncbi:hypothetical protein CDG60_08320 [Acinetobacter chinensis]|uniref:Lipoprotein n=1 Tax=Acinetobacter chinensis TaxID=2004650 RepID=A0A3B7M1L2_9GAMM|nr:hypothetical protein [Acinetobacter chinensis]AXY56569.1 hypothetical protein CDG60_08320 [Acinetobacter chinensis]